MLPVGVCVGRVVVSAYSGQLLCTAEGHSAPIKDVRWITTGKYILILCASKNCSFKMHYTVSTWLSIICSMVYVCYSLGVWSIWSMGVRGMGVWSIWNMGIWGMDVWKTTVYHMQTH